MKHRFLGIIAFVAAFAPATSATAQGASTEVALAEALYRQARQLMAEGKIAEACPKFAESHRLDPAAGTLLNLAGCHEAAQKFATAWLEYVEAATLARREQREDRVRFAQERQSALEPKLSRLVVVVPPAADIPELEIRVDGAPIRAAARGVPTPVDPGVHMIEASARDRKPWLQRIEIEPGAKSSTVTVPVLEAAPAAPVESSKTARAPDDAPAPERIWRPVPTGVYVAGSLTAVTTIGAVATGLVYAGKNTGGDRTGTTTMGQINLVFWGATVVGAGITTYLYLARPEKRESVRTAGTTFVSPWVTASGGGLVLQGSL